LNSAQEYKRSPTLVGLKSSRPQIYLPADQGDAGDWALRYAFRYNLRSTQDRPFDTSLRDYSELLRTGDGEN